MNQDRAHRLHEVSIIVSNFLRSLYGLEELNLVSTNTLHIQLAPKTFFVVLFVVFDVQDLNERQLLVFAVVLLDKHCHNVLYHYQIHA
jgi:hypothetical protein